MIWIYHQLIQMENNLNYFKMKLVKSKPKQEFIEWDDIHSDVYDKYPFIIYKRQGYGNSYAILRHLDSFNYGFVGLTDNIRTEFKGEFAKESLELAFAHSEIHIFKTFNEMIEFINNESNIESY